MKSPLCADHFLALFAHRWLSHQPIVPHQFSAYGRLSRQGFTLLEVMVALAIFTVAAIAITKVTMNYTQSIGQMQQRTLGHFVAMNELARMEISGEWPEGTSEKIIEEQGSQWLVAYQVANTLSEEVRRIELQVSAPAAASDTAVAGVPPNRAVITRISAFLKRPVQFNTQSASANPVPATPHD